MAKVYGTEFAGFLDQIVPKILECLKQEEFSFNLGDPEGDEPEFDEDDEDADPLKIHTGITIEKKWHLLLWENWLLVLVINSSHMLNPLLLSCKTKLKTLMV